MDRADTSPRTNNFLQVSCLLSVGAKHWVPSDFLISLRERKIMKSDSIQHDLSLMVLSFLYLQVPRRLSQRGVYSGISLLLSVVRGTIRSWVPTGMGIRGVVKQWVFYVHNHGHVFVIQVVSLCMWRWAVSQCEIMRCDSEWACGFVCVCVCVFPGFMSP